MANALWSWLFFSWHQGAPAFYEILILWFFYYYASLPRSGVRALWLVLCSSLSGMGDIYHRLVLHHVEIESSGIGRINSISSDEKTLDFLGLTKRCRQRLRCAIYDSRLRLSWQCNRRSQHTKMSRRLRRDSGRRCFLTGLTGESLSPIE